MNSISMPSTELTDMKCGSMMDNAPSMVADIIPELTEALTVLPSSIMNSISMPTTELTEVNCGSMME